ncbi:unnamed protein product [Closterium sp. Naga37s-1]|nr:unnamed protein product [Closterium sp. Naga37s-1]
MVLEDLVGAWGDFTGSDTWKDSDKKCDHYVGIKCADNGYVINIDLSGNSITGSAASLSKFTALSYIDVSGNSNLNTGFSSLTNLKQLKHLSVTRRLFPHSHPSPLMHLLLPLSPAHCLPLLILVRDIADTGYEGSISTFVSKLTALTHLYAQDHLLRTANYNSPSLLMSLPNPLTHHSLPFFTTPCNSAAPLASFWNACHPSLPHSASCCSPCTVSFFHSSPSAPLPPPPLQPSPSPPPFSPTVPTALPPRATHTTTSDMSSNSLTGSIPNFISALQKLVYLGLSASGEDGLKGTLPSGLGKLTRLNELYLQRNGLSGPVSVLTSLTKLNRLLLGNNYFNGSFPQGFSNLKSLNYLSMRYNGFEGRIPNTISTLTKLTYLSLNNNRFKGIIPRTITALTKLSNLLLQDNFLDGYVPSFSSLKTLTEVDLSANYFTGPPPSFYKAPTTLNLDDNYFFGSSLPKDKDGKTICAASLAKNCLTISSSEGDSLPADCCAKALQRTAAACSAFCGTSGNVQCGGIRIGVCYPSDKVVETSGSTIDPGCLCANGWKLSDDKQKCTK